MSIASPQNQDVLLRRKLYLVLNLFVCLLKSIWNVYIINSSLYLFFWWTVQFGFIYKTTFHNKTLNFRCVLGCVLKHLPGCVWCNKSFNQMWNEMKKKKMMMMMKNKKSNIRILDWLRWGMKRRWMFENCFVLRFSWLNCNKFFNQISFWLR